MIIQFHDVDRSVGQFFVDWDTAVLIFKNHDLSRPELFFRDKLQHKDVHITMKVRGCKVHIGSTPEGEISEAKDVVQET